jgi:anthranilate phosphoribosyltransferase
VGLGPDRAVEVLDRAGMVFLFAPAYHPAMKHVVPTRKALGIPTLMNLLGPLANPAGVRHQVVGVADRDRAPLVAAALARLGTAHALVVHAEVGMDEISPTGLTRVWEVRHDTVREWILDPARYGLAHPDLASLAGGEPAANAARMVRLLEGEADPAGSAAVLLNAAAAVYVAGLEESLERALERAREVLCAGQAREALERLRVAAAAQPVP